MYLLGTLQQDVRSVDVVLSELEGISEGIVDMRLRGEVKDRIDLFLSEQVRDEVGRADVALHELKRSKGKEQKAREVHHLKKRQGRKKTSSIRMRRCLGVSEESR